MASIEKVKTTLDKIMFEALERRGEFLIRALRALKEVEYDIDLRIIADIEEELNKGLYENDIRE